MGTPVTPVHGDFVARVSGLDLSNPLDDGDFGQARAAFHRYAVLVMHRTTVAGSSPISSGVRS